MSNKQISIYLASGWFTSNTQTILNNLELLLDSREDVKLYSPRRDGIMLTPNQLHDTAVRENVFKDNISHILSSDLVLANIDSTDSYNDPGTMYEIGYAMANGIPVLGFARSEENIKERFKGIIPGFEFIVMDYTTLNTFLNNFVSHVPEKVDNPKNKVLFVGAGDEVDNKLASYIMESGADLRWVNEMHDDIYSRINEIFDGVDYMIAVIDNRKTLVSWMIGQAYARGIPVITYSDYNYGINVMLLISILTHIRGTEELVKFLQQVKREGIKSIPKFDISQMESM